MSASTSRARLGLLSGLVAGVLATVALHDRASASAPPDESPEAPVEVEPEPPPTWRFRKTDRPVKVIVLAGSIGAWQRDPYADHFEDWCSNVEVENLSKVGFGAFQLRQRFMDQVVANGYVNLRAPEYEYWLVYQGGLNSVGTPEKTNKEVRQLFMAAHQRGVDVVALSPTPWGDDTDTRRWKGLAGLDYKRFTQKLVDFELGRLSPRDALGRYIDARTDPDAPWDKAELADVSVDLYDSPLRDREAPLRDLAKLRTELSKDKTWQKRFAALDETSRELALDEWAARAAEIPRWYMKPELRSFDHIHPNEKGHRIIAEVACPKLPPSWGCSCPQ
jgi:hypothetical protein